MLTAIILTTALVFAVSIYSIMRASGRCSRIEELESVKWGNNYRCNGECENCTQECEYHSIFKEV